MRNQVIILAVLTTAARLAFAYPNEPKGFGKAHFGMTVDEVKKIFPKMKQVGNPTPETAALLAVYTLEAQSVYGLKPCTVTLHFNPTKLYQVTCDCGRDVNVPVMLQKKFGDPTQAVRNSAFWLSEGAMISFNTKSRTFAFIDKKLNDEFQGRLGKYVMEQQAKASAPTEAGSPTPGATPQ